MASVSSPGQSAQEITSDIVHLTSAMTSARLTVLGRAHFHSLPPLCHSLCANPSFPPFISISHPSITHHLLSLGHPSSPSCGYCSFSEHLSLSLFFHLPFITYHPDPSYSVAQHRYPHPRVPFPPSIQLTPRCQTQVLEQFCPLNNGLLCSFSLFRSW